jgi:hypothetical protein
MKIFEILTIYKKINGILRLQSYNDSDGVFFRRDILKDLMQYFRWKIHHDYTRNNFVN